MGDLGHGMILATLNLICKSASEDNDVTKADHFDAIAECEALSNCEYKELFDAVRVYVTKNAFDRKRGS